MSSSNSPCAACKCLRRKCTQECVFAPYFPPDNPQKFTNVHKVFGASNVTKILNELSPNQREDAVNSLAFEAEYRLKDPIYGCVGMISVLQNRLALVRRDLELAKKDLATYIGPQALMPMLNQPGLIQQGQGQGQYPQSAYQMIPYNNTQQMMVLPTDGTQQQHILEAQVTQQMMRDQDMIRAYEQHYQNPHMQQPYEIQNDFVRFNNGFDEVMGNENLAANGFNQNVAGATEMLSSLGLGNNYGNIPYHHIQPQLNVHEQSQQIQLQAQELFLPQPGNQQQPPEQITQQFELELELELETAEKKDGPSC